MQARDKLQKTSPELSTTSRYIYEDPNKVHASGSYGKVYKGKDLQSNKTVAIKKTTNIFENLADAKKFLREIKLLRMLNDHPNIIKLLGIRMPASLETFTDVELVFEWAETDLYKILTSKQDFTPEHSQYFLYQLLLGTHYIHSAHILHRDLKPANLLISPKCDLKIADFGLSRIHEAANKFVNISDKDLQTNNKNSNSNSTMQDNDSEEKNNSVQNNMSDNHNAPPSEFFKFRRLSKHVITRWYRPPEVIFLSPYDSAADMWSIGCIFAELLRKQINNNARPDPLFGGATCEPLSGEAETEKFLSQLTTILNILAEPSKTNKDSYDLISDPKALNVIFAKIFPGVDLNAIDLLTKLLAFYAENRFTTEEALRHPYFKDYPDPFVKFDLNFLTAEQEALIKECVELEMKVENKTHNKNYIRQEIIKEINYYNKTPAVAAESKVVAINNNSIANTALVNSNTTLFATQPIANQNMNTEENKAILGKRKLSNG